MGTTWDDGLVDLLVGLTVTEMVSKWVVLSGNEMVALLVFELAER